MRTGRTAFLLAMTATAVLAVIAFVIVRPTSDAEWPDRIAVIGTKPGRVPVAFLAVADPVRRVVVSVPVDATVEIPGQGFLRAHHAWTLGGATTVAQTLGNLFGVEVPFSAAGEGSTYEDVLGSSLAIEPSRDEAAVRGALRDGSESWRRIDVGTRAVAQSVELDPASVREASVALGGRPAGPVRTSSPPPPPNAPASPTPAPSSVDRGTVTVDVRNAGEVAGAAGRTADKLRTLGYKVGYVGDYRPQREDGIVYFASGKEAEGRQVAADLGLGAEPVPGGVSMRPGSHVLVLLGNGD
jgi:hypothetical protein